MSHASLNTPSVHYFIIRANEILLNEDNSVPNQEDIKPIANSFLRSLPLGTFDKAQYYCSEIDSNISIPSNLKTLTLRNTLSLLDANTTSIAVKAYSVINWDRRHQFCSSCGASTKHKAKSYERKCTSCELSFYPRITPSIIVLIKKGDQVLMARSPHFSPGIYSLIAGFVEAGESLEEAVHREVKEEVGIKIGNISYFGSQPWPFPDVLMIAYTADYVSGEISIDQDEIEDAGWYKYDNLPGKPSSTYSISTKLLDSFVDLFTSKA